MKRIAYLTLKGTARTDRLPAQPGVTVDEIETLVSVRPVDPMDLLLSDVAYAEAGLRAAAHGYDGIVIGALPDYGAAAVRAAVDVPVMGCGQASLVTAASLGDRFGIVTIWPETMAFVYERLLREQDAADRCTSVRYVSTPAEQATLADDDNFLSQMKDGREHMVRRILDEIDAVAAQGAASVILGCNCMSPVAGVLAARASIPVVDPTAAGHQVVRSMLTLGVRPARDTRVPASTRQPMLAEMLLAGDELAGAPDDCPVCVLEDDGRWSCDAP
ncbi:aspartate/glutamate racemase family protein [Nocardioides sp. YIM 152315]|uniref:aspartate/glutamate racemase family protein n=1 Tax=Nocardioides sp. YIM 152315 TaxID=3031760 RepID=UPI0023DC7D88|nr:aspartate/glutamate racemase family protein [Nocardioides sp. YIM 152315]MDF1606507.1 aspartate/glutamate racemase family protein [Nocardioides sp. YIM 152315]